MKLRGKRYLYLLTLIALLILGFFVFNESSDETSGGWTKFKGNPVFGDKLGTVFDVSVLKEGDKFHMWFSWRPKESVALTESSDGIHWTEPVIVLGPNEATEWEERINRPAVLKHSGQYHMWYTGQTDDKSFIGHAVSPNGINWKRASEKPALAPELPWEKSAVMCPSVIWDEKEQIYKMWYSGGDQYEPDAIGYATSRDGYTWKKESQPVFLPSKCCEWDSFKVTGSQVIYMSGWYVMFYIGFKDVNHAMIGLARSRDGISNWQRYPENPIINPGSYFSWDHDAVYKPFAILTDDGWYLWYNGRRGSTELIGLAFHEDKDLKFE